MTYADFIDQLRSNPRFLVLRASPLDTVKDYSYLFVEVHNEVPGPPGQAEMLLYHVIIRDYGLPTEQVWSHLV